MSDHARHLEAYRAFWTAWQPIRDEVNAVVRQAGREHPAFRPIMEAMTESQLQDRDARNALLQSEALLNGSWEPYLADVRAQGRGYAEAGVPFEAWFEIVSTFRDEMSSRILLSIKDEPERLVQVIGGMDRFVDTVMRALGSAYIEAKEQLISRQQDAIREASTPVLQIRDQLLVLPIIGVVDTYRARLLTESLLHAIRDRRARVVVMDITGVAVVDSKVANHLVQTVEAARLMGASVIVTGISPEIARTLVTIGADLRAIATVGDLQGGLEVAERMLPVGLAEVR